MAKVFWRRFWADEDGAVTVDWVVLTGGILIFGILVTAAIIAGANESATGMGSRLSAAEVPQVRFE